MSIQNLIDNATSLSNSLGTAATDFIDALKSMRDEVVRLEAELIDKRTSVQNEIDRLNSEIAAKRQQHDQLEASIATLRAELAKESAKIDAVLRAA